MEAMCERGAVVSEAPMGTPPERQRFPLRNRIISGLAQAVVVVEGGEASGALITVRHAAAQRRQVYAVPGSVFAPGSRGPHRLLAQGAAPCVDPADLLRRLGVPGAAPGPAAAGTQELGEDEARVWRVLDHAAAPVDQIAARAGLPAARCAAALGMLEIRGIVRRCAGHRFARRSTFGRGDAARTAGGDVWPNHSLS
jgi:DNA processing protein